MIVVSDTSPLCYLLLIDLIDLLPQLYDHVVIPQAVCAELANSKSPAIIQAWILQPPDWLEVQVVAEQSEAGLRQLDLGESEAIALAGQLNADFVLLDDKAARQVAVERGLKLVGILGILGVAAKQGRVNFPEAITRLQQTTFRASASLVQSLLERYGPDR